MSQGTLFWAAIKYMHHFLFTQVVKINGLITPFNDFHGWNVHWIYKMFIHFTVTLLCVESMYNLINLIKLDYSFPYKVI